jgi:hypothetical protein
MHAKAFLVLSTALVALTLTPLVASAPSLRGIIYKATSPYYNDPKKAGSFALEKVDEKKGQKIYDEIMAAPHSGPIIAKLDSNDRNNLIWMALNNMKPHLFNGSDDLAEAALADNIELMKKRFKKLSEDDANVLVNVMTYLNAYIKDHFNIKTSIDGVSKYIFTPNAQIPESERDVALEYMALHHKHLLSTSTTIKQLGPALKNIFARH